MKTTLQIIAVGTLNIACFLIGAKIGQTVSKGEKIETPTLNPVKVYKEFKENREAEEEKNKMETILENIERYDGTPFGQQDVPG